MSKLIFIDSSTKNSFIVKMLGNNSQEKFSSRNDAIRYASQKARQGNLELIFRRKDGIFQFRNSYLSM